MYAYRKSMPRANKHLEEKWVKHCQKLHKQRLTQMKPAIDNKPPARFIHLSENLKKQQMDEERYSQIERDNYLLLDKMSHIMTHAQLLDEKYMGPPVTFGKSLNKEYRKKELMRITEENQQILRRIQHKEPYYSHEQWQEQAVRDSEYLRNCAEYPIVLPASQTIPRSPTRVSKKSPPRKAKTAPPTAHDDGLGDTHAVGDEDELVRRPSRGGREPVLTQVAEEEAEAAEAAGKGSHIDDEHEGGSTVQYSHEFHSEVGDQSEAPRGEEGGEVAEDAQADQADGIPEDKDESIDK